jgi:hypothetical protein
MAWRILALANIAHGVEAAMTHFASRRLRQSAFVTIAALGLVFGASRGAHAFTYGPANGVSPDGSANLQDPDRQFDSTAGSHGQATMQLGGGVSLQFGARDPRSSFDAEYNSDVERMFNPVGSPDGPDGR